MRKLCMAFLAWGILACAGADPVTSKPYLTPYPGSRVISGPQQGVGAIEYEIDEPYPAARVLQFIRSRVPAEFRPRNEDFMNPGIPTSHVRGWTHHTDLMTQPSSEVHQWQAEWEDAEGNILTYALIYRSPGDVGDQPSSTKLHVTGILVPRAQADALRESARRALAVPPPATQS